MKILKVSVNMDGEEKALLITPELDRVIRRYVDGILFAGITKSVVNASVGTQGRRKHLTDEQKASMVEDATSMRGTKSRLEICKILSDKYNIRSILAVATQLRKLGFKFGGNRWGKVTDAGSLGA